MAAQRLSPIHPDGTVRCFTHQLQAVLRTSHTVTNPNRQFYACPLHPDKQCDFFFWKDQLPKNETSQTKVEPPSTPTHPPTTSTRFPPLATPTSPGTHSQPQSTTRPSSSTKRRSPFNNSDEARQKRFKAVQNALSPPPSNAVNVDSREHASQPGSSRQSGTTSPATPQSARASRLAQSIREALRTPVSPPHTSSSNITLRDSTGRWSPTPTPAGPTTYRLSDLDFDLSGRRPPVSQQPLSVANTLQDKDPDERDEKNEDELWTALTPSSSADEVANNLLRRNDKGKGKQKAKDSDSEDEGNWFKDIPSASISPPNLFSSMHTRPAAPSDTSGLSGDKIQHIINDLIGIPEYVQRLERKLAAMEKSNSIKAKRIRELEDEIRELKSPRGGGHPQVDR